jgi:hypothetical protein
MKKFYKGWSLVKSLKGFFVNNPSEYLYVKGYLISTNIEDVLDGSGDKEIVFVYKLEKKVYVEKKSPVYTISDVE